LNYSSETCNVIIISGICHMFLPPQFTSGIPN